MKIALIGYGKMGRAIEEMALAKGHEITLRVSSHNTDQLHKDKLAGTDVAIEFSRPESAVDNIILCLEAGLPVVCGTTGWLDDLEKVENTCMAKEGAFLYASNFSIGVNIFFAINKSLAQMMDQHDQYEVSIREIHHTQKLDAPSGTALTLAGDILKRLKRKSDWTDDPEGDQSMLPVFSERIDKVPGTHEIRYSSPIDTIEIKHVAHSRAGFASGALLAAEWIAGKKGCFRMKDVLGF